MELLIAFGIGTFFGIGVFQLLRRNVIRSALGIVIISYAVNLILLSAGAFKGEVPPYTGLVGQPSDALPQALILTAIVISIGGFALVLEILYVLSMRYKTSDLDEINQLKH